MKDYLFLEDEIFNRPYCWERKRFSLVDLYVNHNDIYKKLCKRQEIDSEIITLFNRIGGNFKRIYDTVDIAFFRQMKCAEILQEYYDNLIKKEQRISKITHNKAEKDIKKVTSKNSLKKDSKKEVKKDSKKDAKADIKKNDDTEKKKKTIYRVMHTKEEIQEAEREKELKRAKAREKREILIQEYKQKCYEEQLKKEQEEERKRIEYEQRIEEIRRKKKELYEREQAELKKLPQIGYKDFVVRKSTFKCSDLKHHVEDISAAITVITKAGTTKLMRVHAGYCRECKVFFVMHSTYEELKGYGIPACRMLKHESQRVECFNEMGLAAQSILMQCGYNVSQTENLSDTTRQKILALLVDNEVLNKSTIISYLDFFISQRQYQSKYELAISKWEKDRDFIADYKIGNYTMYGIREIYI